MSYDQCQFCGDIAFKTNGKSELICESRTYSGQCKKEKQEAKADKPSRNQPCPCGSGKKYKRCCAIKQLAEKSAGCGVTVPQTDIKCYER